MKVKYQPFNALSSTPKTAIRYWLWPMVFAYSLLFCSACSKDPTSIPSFREMPSPTTQDLSSIAFADSLHGTLTGGKAWKEGLLMSTDDGGLSWHTDTVFDYSMEQVCFDSKGQGYVCGQNFLFYRPVGEAHWRLFSDDYQWLRSCHFPNGQRGAMVGGEGYHSGLLRTFGPDPFWATDTLQRFPNELESVWYSDSLTLHAVGFGWVMRSADAGHSWQRLDFTGDFFQCVHFPTASTGYICGSSGSILKTTDGGQHWQNIRKGGSIGNRQKAFRALWFVTPDKGWIVGDEGVFWQTEDGGTSWQPVAEAPEDADFTHVFFLGNKGWATAKNGRLFCFEG